MKIDNPEVLRCVEEAVAEHATPKEQIECAIAKVQALATYRSLADGLAAKAVQDMVYDLRHKQNCKLRYGTPGERPEHAPKVRVFESSALQAAYAQLYQDKQNKQDKQDKNNS